MFTVSINGVEAQILFTHRSVERLTTTGTETVDQTAAMICDVNGIIVPGTTVGFSHRSPNDTFQPWEGRAFAAARAAQGIRVSDADGYWDLCYAMADAAAADLVARKARDAKIEEVNRLLDQADDLATDVAAAQDRLEGFLEMLTCSE